MAETAKRDWIAPETRKGEAERGLDDKLFAALYDDERALRALAEELHEVQRCRRRPIRCKVL